MLGELFATEARRRGLAGVVIDGRCRDVAGLRALGLPVFARGTIPASGSTVVARGAARAGPLGGVDVQHGDIVFADDDGVVIAPAAQLEAALETGEFIGRAERAMLEGMRAGTPLHDMTNHADTSRRSTAARRARSPSRSTYELHASPGARARAAATPS